MLKGIDVSEHQGVINWERVKENIDFAMLRAGYGTTEANAKKYSCQMWQYTEYGSMSGINGRVDMNYEYRGLREAIKDAGLNNLGNKLVPAPPKPSYKLVPQNGKCTVVVDELMIREKPSTSSKTVGSYSRGESVNYDYYVDNEGYRWISWISVSGKRRYMAVRVLSTNKRYGNCV